MSVVDSPRSRRSVQEGPSTVFHPPTVSGEEYARDGNTVDPTGTTTIQQPPVPGSPHNSTNSKRFSSRLSQLAKRVMGQPSIDDPERRAEEGFPSTLARGPSPPATPSAGSSSDVYEGTTAVDHDNYGPPFAQTIGSPVYVVPKPTTDYAKMELPSRASIASFNSYINRVKQFLHELNELPWVAERVTVDYVPGASKDRRRVRINQLHRPLSWYGNTPHSRPSLFSDSTESPSAQLHQVQILSQDQFPTLQSLNRSHSAQQPRWAQQEPPRTPTPRQEVFWEVIDTPNSSNVPYATVVPANWTLHQAVPPEPLQPTIVTRQLPEPQPAANPPSTVPQPPASTRLYPGLPTDGFQRFVPIGETYPTGYVPYENVASIEAAYQDRGFHPQSQDPIAQQGGLASMTTSAAQAGQDGFGTGVPQTTRGLDTPVVTSPAQAGGTTPYNPSTHPPVVAPTPRVASGSVASTPSRGPANAGASPPATVTSRASSRKPPSSAPSRATRTSQRSHGPAPSVRTVQSQNRPPSAAPSRASRASSAAHAMSQTPNRP